MVGERRPVITYLQKLRLFSRNVRLYLITAALVGFCYMGIYVVLFNLYLLRLGYGPEFIGLVSSANALAYAISAFPAGALGRRWGIRRTTIAGVNLIVAGLGLPPLAELAPAAMQPGWLLVTYSLAWCGASLYSVNADVFIMGATGPEERSYAFSMQMALWPLAGFAGSLVGGLLPGLFATLSRAPLAHPAPYRYSLLIAALLFTPAVPTLLATSEVTTAHTRESAASMRHAPYGLIGLLALVQLLQGAGEGVTRTFFNVYLDVGLHVATQQIGTLAAVGQLLSVPAALVTPLLVDRWGNRRVFIWASLGTALSLLPLALIPHWGAAGFGSVGVMALAAVWHPAYIMYRMEITSPSWWAVVNGATNMAMGLSWSGMSLGGGYIVTALGYPSLFLTGAGVTAAGALLFWAIFNPRSRLVGG